MGTEVRVIPQSSPAQLAADATQVSSDQLANPPSVASKFKSLQVKGAVEKFEEVFAAYLKAGPDLADLSMIRQFRAYFLEAADHIERLYFAQNSLEFVHTREDYEGWGKRFLTADRLFISYVAFEQSLGQMLDPLRVIFIDRVEDSNFFTCYQQLYQAASQVHQETHATSLRVVAIINAMACVGDPWPELKKSGLRAGTVHRYDPNTRSATIAVGAQCFAQVFDKDRGIPVYDGEKKTLVSIPRDFRGRLVPVVVSNLAFVDAASMEQGGPIAWCHSADFINAQLPRSSMPSKFYMNELRFVLPTLWGISGGDICQKLNEPTAPVVQALPSEKREHATRTAKAIRKDLEKSFNQAIGCLPDRDGSVRAQIRSDIEAGFQGLISQVLTIDACRDTFHRDAMAKKRIAGESAQRWIALTAAHKELLRVLSESGDVYPMERHMLVEAISLARRAAQLLLIATDHSVQSDW